MYVAVVSAECAPIAKAGGLGDFIHGIARELIAQGQDVEVLLPHYDVLRQEHLGALTPVGEPLAVPWARQLIPTKVWAASVDGVRCLLIDPQSPEQFFSRGTLYGEPDDVARFAFFCCAVLEYYYQQPRHPEVIHCHDWQTGLLPVLLYERYEALGMRHTRVCYSLHNIGYQGWTDSEVLHHSGLDPQRLLTADRLQDPGNPQGVNLMKGGIVFSNFVTTVSPRYAWEVQHTDQGMGLQPLLQQYQHKFAGLLNGIDYDTWNPATDPLIAKHYDHDTLPAKAKNREALRQRLGLASADCPIVAVISRLERQKGVELILHTLDYTLAHQGQFVLLGSASEPALKARFEKVQVEQQHNPHAHLELAYDEELAHLIYAGSDLLVVPSVYEPCGLTQMIAMRYGCVPVVRRVGGLADTVFDANYSDHAFEERNGYVFDELTPEGIESALSRAFGLWYDYPDYFRQLRLNGMLADHSWHHPAQQYLAIYQGL